LLISWFLTAYSGSGSDIECGSTRRSLSAKNVEGSIPKTKYLLPKVALHPSSAFDTPSHIIADFMVSYGLLRQRLRYRMWINARLPEREAVEGSIPKTKYLLPKVALHPPSAFDTPGHIIADFRVSYGLLRQRLRYRIGSTRRSLSAKRVEGSILRNQISVAKSCITPAFCLRYAQPHHC
jgi:hypothetical protein